MSEISTVYICSNCDNEHGTEWEAEECCQPEIWTMYKCCMCLKNHENKQLAEQCCDDSDIRCPNCTRDYSENDLNASAITVSGHCTVCNPLFSAQEEFEIKDLHHEKTGNHGSVSLGSSSIQGVVE